MNIVFQTGEEEIATVYVARLKDDSLIEFVESTQPPIPRSEKWVLIISTLKGCPIACPICDAGGNYKGILSYDELLGQIDHMITKRFPDKTVPIPKLKIQFARMGDPAFNNNVLTVLEKLPDLYKFDGLLPSISTIAPFGFDSFFEKLLTIKKQQYMNGNFQMQFSIHSTSFEERRMLIPVKTWSFKQMGDYGKRFFSPGDRKLTINFAAVKGFPLDPASLLEYFPPDIFLVKLTPVNPTASSIKMGMEGLIKPENMEKNLEIERTFQDAGYETILSIGEIKENAIGSNCGMYVGKVESV
jgi:23S rRNA (adenine2503-C2)-methyltransferase